MGNFIRNRYEFVAEDAGGKIILKKHFDFVIENRSYEIYSEPTNPGNSKEKLNEFQISIVDYKKIKKLKIIKDSKILKVLDFEAKEK